MACTCIKATNEVLSPNSLDTCFLSFGGDPQVVIRVLTPRGTNSKDKRYIPAKFCPFCGTSYSEEK